MLAIGPLAGEGGVAPAKTGEPAALPAGQAARVDGKLTKGLGVAGVGAEERPARWDAGGQARRPRRLRGKR
jgi:hypothetical protein